MQIIALKEGPDRANRKLALLTRRERQVLRLVSCGQANKEIAYSLDISISTVKTHVAKLIAIGFSNRTQIARWAIFHPEVLDAGNAVDIALHFPGCPCDHARCAVMRTLDTKPSKAA